MTLDKPEKEKIKPSGYLSLSQGKESIAFWQQICSETAPHIFYLHGFRTDMSSQKAMFVQNLCAKHHFSCTKIDYRGHGQSSGAYTDFTVSDWLEDALQTLDTQIKGPVFLAGASLGGWLSLLVARQRPSRVQGVIGIASAPSFPTQLVLPALTAAQHDELNKKGEISLTDDGSQDVAIFTKRLIDDAKQHDVFSSDFEISAPAHLLHGMQDRSVPWSLALKLAQHMKAPDVHLNLIKDGDHYLHRPSDLSTLEQTLLQVAGRNHL